MKPWYHFWNWNSGLFGGITLGAIIGAAYALLLWVVLCD